MNFSCFCIPCIRTNTSYTDQEIRRCFREFLKDCPEGTLTRDQVLLIYVFVLVYTFICICVFGAFKISTKCQISFLGGDNDDESFAKDA